MVKKEKKEEKEKEKILKKVEEAGIVGCGGAGFPTHLKLRNAVSTLLVNAAECEPLIFTDQYIMENMAREVVKGAVYVARVVSASEIIFCVKAKYKKAIARIQSAIKDEKLLDGSIKLEIKEFEDFYPLGDEHVLTLEATGKPVPPMGLPLDCDVLVQNVGTLKNITLACENSLPVTEKILTINGAIEKPVVVSCEIGTPILSVLKNTVPHIIEEDNLKEEFAIIEGGPMMGTLVTDINTPVTKTTGALLILPKDSPCIRERTITLNQMLKLTSSVCCQCRMCTDICPRFLNGHPLYPHLIMRGLAHISKDFESYKSVFLCCECGVCSFYACPMFLSPRNVNRFYKNELKKAGINIKFPEENIEIFPYREYRKIPYKRLLRRLGVYEYDMRKPVFKGKIIEKYLNVPLKQHVGAQAIPVVKKGDKVKKGDLIAKAVANAPSANIHSPVTGKIEEVTEKAIKIFRES